MKKYLKLGALALALLSAGYLLGTGSIGNLLRYGDETIAAAADDAETQAVLSDLEREFATAERSECGLDPTIGSGTEIPTTCEVDEE